MLRSCKHCGRIHDTKADCGKKPKRVKEVTNKDKFRWTKTWQDKREEIKDRDLRLCQICIRKLYNTVDQYTYDGLQVHHAIPLEEDFERRLDNDILLTMCGCHHEMAESGEIPRKVILEIIQEQESRYGR